MASILIKNLRWSQTQMKIFSQVLELGIIQDGKMTLISQSIPRKNLMALQHCRNEKSQSGEEMQQLGSEILEWFGSMLRLTLQRTVDGDLTMQTTVHFLNKS